MNRGFQFEKNRREYYAHIRNTIDVARDTYGLFDLFAIFSDEARLISMRCSGRLTSDERSELAEKIPKLDEVYGVRIEFLRDLSKSNGNTNTTHTILKRPGESLDEEDVWKRLDYHRRKIIELGR